LIIYSGIYKTYTHVPLDSREKDKRSC